ncbi:MAG TPA: (d)CMP kinase [Xanthobacteraceae bacterium]|nr:(d)CMP kinase [Xanthobacteraceae bacterium]
MIVTVDGPAASGKGTLARALARHLELPHLDTGLLYRAVGAAVIAAGKRPDDRAAAVAAAQAVDLAHLDAGWLSSKHLGEAASVVAAIPEVRAALLDFQQAFARRPGGAVLDGRDTGTVIAPAAEAKIFVTAAAERRAERRHRELVAQGETITLDEVLADLKRRDARDAGRAIAPLKPAPDAVLLDTTELDIEAAIRAALAIVEAARAGRGRG